MRPGTKLSAVIAVVLALPACWSRATTSSAPEPPLRSSSDRPAPPISGDTPDKLVPVVMMANDGAIHAHLCKLVAPEGMECRITCISSCNFHVLGSQRFRARELVHADPWLMALVRVTEEHEYQAMIAPPEPLAPRVEISRVDIDRQLAGTVRLHRRGDSAALCDPMCVDSNPGGILVVSVASGSVFARIGLRDGDLVTAFDGQPIHVADGFRAAQVARARNRFRIDIRRKGKPMSTEVVVVGQPAP